MKNAPNSNVMLLGLICLLAIPWPVAASDPAISPATQFEQKVRPLLFEQCVKCHGPEKQKGSLRLDSWEAISKGGELGSVLTPGDSDSSLLIRAVRRIGDIEMPPKSKLNDEQVAILVDWVKKGAYWPGAPANPPKSGPEVGLAPNAPALKEHLQVWLRSDLLPVKDSAQVFRWPDSSGHDRDAFPTSGVYEGMGLPPTFVKSSSINGLPAVHFETNTALATSADRPLPIVGDAGYTMVVVANLKPNPDPSGQDVIVGFGEPVNGANASAGKPAAGLLQIDRGPDEKNRLDHAGGFRRDALLGEPGSFASFYEMPVVLTLIKTPGPMRETSSIFINGENLADRPASGTMEVPDIRQRNDFSLMIGHALEQTGSIVGDMAEVLVYNSALAPSQRQMLEKSLGNKYGILIFDPKTDLGPETVTNKGRDHWAFRKPVRPAVPIVKTKEKVNTPVDAFILAKLEEKHLGFSPEADRATLIRRVYFDLIGLPPSPAQVQRFVQNDSPEAYERLLDQLLASSNFGERWGAHWLDMAGYVDVTGNDQNAEQTILGPTKWKYRDYVIHSLNEDKPYNRFLMEQLAGDEMVDWRHAPKFTPEIKELLTATGFLRTAIDDTHEVDLNKPAFRYQVVFDTVQIVGNGLMGLTVQCCRCHDHKYDPLTQRDYYRLASLFTPALNPALWLQPKDRELPDVSPAEQARIDKNNAEIDKKIKPLEEKITVIKSGAKARVFTSKLAQLPEASRTDVKVAFDTPADKRSDAQKELAKKFDSQLNVSTNDIEHALSPEDHSQLETLRTELAECKSNRVTYGAIRAFFESGPPPRGYVFVRGDFEHRGRRVNAGFINVLTASPQDVWAGQPTNAAAPTSGRRLAFAKWLTDTNGNAAGLVARVWVNRMWQQLFGEGLVPTPDNFGVAGQPPTHPELLDWLTTEFLRSNWQAKPMIKLMMMSSVYRQASRPDAPDKPPDADPVAADPDNHLLWRMRVRRLESEAIRDSILAVSDKLDPTMGGPAVPVQTTPDGTCSIGPADQLPTPTSQWRRTIYLMSRRNFHLSILSSFDQPTLNGSCPRRMSSSVVLQPLTMLNDAFVLEQSSYFADRVAQMAPSEPAARVKLAFEIGLGRKPSAEELGWSLKFLEDQAENHRAAKTPWDQCDRKALANLCQMVLNTSEFLYEN